MTESILWRLAALSDIPALETLIATSSRGLAIRDYTREQIEAALQSAWGVDSQLIVDGTYFVAEVDQSLVACGGFSGRATLFGGDRQPDRTPQLLDPAVDGVRIRAFFVHPDWARRGLGRELLRRCEAAARAAGFTSAELVATLPGQRLYAAHGYVSHTPRSYPLAAGESITFVPMSKRL